MAFANAQGIDIYGGSFADVAGDYHQHIVQENRSEAGIAALHSMISPGAAFDSDERHPPPKCHPGTREAILDKIISWVNAIDAEDQNERKELQDGQDRKESIRDLSDLKGDAGPPTKEDQVKRILWLHGAAGAGKSAIAQTISEICEEKGQLAGSFFFSRGSVDRQKPGKLFPTMAFDFSVRIPGLREAIGKAVKSDLHIPSKSLEFQVRKLIIEPFKSCSLIKGKMGVQSSGAPFLFVLDGLDECEGRESQCRIIWYISDLVKKHRLALSFLVVARPEPHLVKAFDTPTMRCITETMSLQGDHQSEADVLSFLLAEFARIHDSEQHSYVMASVPKPWPSSTQIKKLVLRSSGYFIYASTVIKFIDEEFFRPTERLNSILNYSAAAAYTELDKLYHQILSMNPNTELVVSILRFFVTLPPETPIVIEAILELLPGDLLTALRGMHSLLDFDIKGKPTDKITFAHASFYDFLFDPDRAKEFYIDPTTCHMDAACRYLRLMRLWGERSKSSRQEVNETLQCLLMNNIENHLTLSTDTAQVIHVLQSIDESTWRAIAQILEAHFSIRIYATLVRWLQDRWPVEELREIINKLWDSMLHLLDGLYLAQFEDPTLDGLLYQRSLVLFLRFKTGPVLKKDIIRVLYKVTGHTNNDFNMAEESYDIMAEVLLAEDDILHYCRGSHTRAFSTNDIFAPRMDCFIRNPQRCGPFFVDPSISHTHIALACIDLLRDRCCKEFSDHGLEHVYAREFWASHLALSSPGNDEIISRLRTIPADCLLHAAHWSSEISTLWRAFRSWGLRSRNDTDPPPISRPILFWYRVIHLLAMRPQDAPNIDFRHWAATLYIDDDHRMDALNFLIFLSFMRNSERVEDFKRTFLRFDIENARLVVEWLNKMPNPPMDVLSRWELYSTVESPEKAFQPNSSNYSARTVMVILPE